MIEKEAHHLQIFVLIFWICTVAHDRLQTAAMVIPEKKIVFVRHGCTYINEYLGENPWGSPHFSDIFPDDDICEQYYRDTPLSPFGVKQAAQLLGKSKPEFLERCELIVTSPLRRALQTLDYGLRPHLLADACRHIPIIALPEAAERLYMISEIGRHVNDIKQEFDYVDFETGFDGKPLDKWWYEPADVTNYVEWRPVGQGQRWACPGEPEDHFNDRMTRLYQWLHHRPEQHVTVVCHWGVISWMLDMDFDNCQWKEVAWKNIRPKALQTHLLTNSIGRSR